MSRKSQHDLVSPDPGYTVRGAASDTDLELILRLQGENLRDALDDAERRSEGFVTLRHDLQLLREMNDPWPHIVATPEGSNDVVAYALVMQRSFRDRLPILAPMFHELERISGRGQRLDGARWYVMGQVCVAKAHRRRGLVEAMYAKHKEQMAADFDYMITEIDATNTRSIRAHEKAGCETIHTYKALGREWVVVALAVNEAAHRPLPGTSPQ